MMTSDKAAPVAAWILVGVIAIFGTPVLMALVTRPLQVMASGAAFGLGHAMWGLLGRSFDAALHAMVSTGILGVALGVVYLAADRSLAPCIVAHFIMTALTEPGLMVGGLRGQLGLRAKRA
jgi:hypothetical protein